MVFRGGSRFSSKGGAHLRKLRRAEGVAKYFGVFRVKKSRFYAKKSYFFPILGGATPPPPGSAPCIVQVDMHLIVAKNDVAI